MGMQAHFSLGEMQANTHVSITPITNRITGEVQAYSGTITINDNILTFGIVMRKYDDGKRVHSDWCWVDIGQDRSMVHALIELRIPFQAS